MVQTTENDFATPKAEAPQGNEKKIIDLFNKGYNFYDIQFEVFRFGGEESLEYIRQVLYKANLLDADHGEPETRLIEE